MSLVPRRLVDATGAVLLDRVEVADRFYPRFVGLMGRSALPRGHGVWFPRCRSVHTFFMRFPLDLVYLSADLTVVGLRDNVRPWCVAIGPSGARGVLETARDGLLREPAIGERLRLV